MRGFTLFLKRFRQFGGMGLIIEYARLGILWPGVKALCNCLIKKQSFKVIYPTILHKVEPMLARRYRPVMHDCRALYKTKHLDRHRSDIIWFCWLQGLEEAPDLVKVCYSSLKKHLSNKEIKIVDNSNWSKYIELPYYVVEKWKKGRIPPANFSDLLRLELLIRYGGTWVDSTVLCTGSIHTEDYLDTDLFMFRYTKPGYLPVHVSNWFITACTNNEVLLVLRDMLYAYWRDYDCVLDYYIFHFFFSLLSKEYPDAMATMPYGPSQRSLALMHHWGETFDPGKWERLISTVSFHKLSYRVDSSTRSNKDNYFNRVIAQA